MSDETEKEKILEAIQELIAGIYIQQLRIYDLLAVLTSERQPEKIKELEKLHESGGILCPDPSLKMD
jgi:hypothetical protein